jgi:hypothetical protein
MGHWYLCKYFSSSTSASGRITWKNKLKQLRWNPAHWFSSCRRSNYFCRLKARSRLTRETRTHASQHTPERAKENDSISRNRVTREFSYFPSEVIQMTKWPWQCLPVMKNSLSLTLVWSSKLSCNHSLTIDDLPRGSFDLIKCQCTQNVLTGCLVEVADVFSPTISLRPVTTSSSAIRLTYREAIRVRSKCIYQSISVKSNEIATPGLADDRLLRQRRICSNTVMIVLVEQMRS